MSLKFGIFLITLICLVIILSALSLKIFNPNFFGSKDYAAPVDIKKDETVILPVGLDNQAVVSAGITYNFIGRITDVRKDGNNFIVTTDITGVNGLPEIIVTDSTNVVKVGEVNEKKRKEDLLVGQKIRIFAYYGIKNNKWFINGVNIIPE